jgi:hypothetical protein
MSESLISFKLKIVSLKYGNREKRGALFAKMYQKQRELAMKSANPVKTYVIEIKIVSLSPRWPGS